MLILKNFKIIIIINCIYWYIIFSIIKLYEFEIYKNKNLKKKKIENIFKNLFLVN